MAENNLLHTAGNVLYVNGTTGMTEVKHDTTLSGNGNDTPLSVIKNDSVYIEYTSTETKGRSYTEVSKIVPGGTGTDETLPTIHLVTNTTDGYKVYDYSKMEGTDFVFSRADAKSKGMEYFTLHADGSVSTRWDSYEATNIVVADETTITGNGTAEKPVSAITEYLYFDDETFDIEEDKENNGTIIRCSDCKTWNGLRQDEHHEIGTATASLSIGKTNKLFHFASMVPITQKSVDDGIIIKCFGTYPDVCAVLRIRTRMANSTDGKSSVRMYRVYTDGNIPDDTFQAGVSTRGADTYIDLFYKPIEAWATMSFKIEWNVSRDTYSQQNRWKLYNSKYTESEKDCYNIYDSIEAAAEVLRPGKTYSYIANITSYTGKVKEADTVSGYKIVVGSVGTDENTIYFV